MNILHLNVRLNKFKENMEIASILKQILKFSTLLNVKYLYNEISNSNKTIQTVYQRPRLS